VDRFGDFVGFINAVIVKNSFTNHNFSLGADPTFFQSFQDEKSSVGNSN
jgi:hypothetical protein